jgi:hypothetical protein
MDITMASTDTILLLAQAATAKRSSCDRNDGFDGNNGGIAAETEAVAAEATVEMVVATATKLRRLQ